MCTLTHIYFLTHMHTHLLMHTQYTYALMHSYSEIQTLTHMWTQTHNYTFKQLTLSCPFSHSLIHIHSHPHRSTPSDTHFLTHSHSCTPTHFPVYTYSHTHTLSLSYIPTCSYVCTAHLLTPHTCSYSLKPTHSHTHKHKHTLTPMCTPPPADPQFLPQPSWGSRSNMAGTGASATDVKTRSPGGPTGKPPAWPLTPDPRPVLFLPSFSQLSWSARRS